MPPAVINDAHEMTAVLTSPAYCGYDPKNVTPLLDGQATLEAIRRALGSLAGRAKPDDTVIIFFSGHGARVGDPANPDSALIPVDCDPADISATVLPEVEFSAALARIKVRRLVVLIDACHSGAVGSFKAPGEASTLDLGFSEKSLGRLAQGAGRVLIASSRASETSLILPGAKNSLFTEHLLGALCGGARTSGDGLIRVFEVFNYISEQFEALHRDVSIRSSKRAILRTTSPFPSIAEASRGSPQTQTETGTGKSGGSLRRFSPTFTRQARKTRISGHAQEVTCPGFA